MKKYIKPNCEMIDVQLEGQILQTSPNTINNELGDAQNGGAWMAPEYKDRNVNIWDEAW